MNPHFVRRTKFKYGIKISKRHYSYILDAIKNGKGQFLGEIENRPNRSRWWVELPYSGRMIPMIVLYDNAENDLVTALRNQANWEKNPWEIRLPPVTMVYRKDV